MANAVLNVGASNAAFNKAITEMSSKLKILKSDFTVASTQAKLFGNAEDQLKAKQSNLNNVIKIQKDMLETNKNKYETLQQTLQKNKVKQEELNIKIKETSKALRDSVKATGEDSEATNELREKLQELNVEYSKNENAIKTNQSRLNSTYNTLNRTKASLMSNESALKNVNKELAGVKADMAAKSFSKISNTADKMYQKLKTISAGILGLGIYGAKASINFEDSMAKVSTIADTTQVPISNLEKQIKELSIQTGIDANDIADNVYNAISAGQKTGDAVNFVSNATKLAKAGFADSASALDILTTTLNAYGLSADEATSVSDKLITTQNLGKTTVAELSADMGKVIPTAKNAGVSVDQLCTAYAQMTINGIKTSESTTYINSMLNELSKSGTKASDALKNATGKTFQELMDEGTSLGDTISKLSEYASENSLSLSDMFGSAEAGKAALTLANNEGKDFNNILSQMVESTGATDKAFNKVNSTTSNLLKKSLNELKISAINLGQAMAPIIQTISDGFKKFADVLMSISPETLQLVSKIGMFVIALTGVLKVISVVTGAISGILGIVSKVQGFLAVFGGLSGIFTSLGTVITTVGSAIAGVFTTIVSIVGWPITIVVGLIAILGTLYATCQPFRDFVNNLWIKIKEFFTGLWTWITQLPQKIQSLWTTITTAISTGWQNIVNFFTQGIPNLIASIGQWLAELPNKFAFFLGEVIGTLIQWNVNVINFLATNIPMWINNISTWFSQLPGVIWNWLVQTITNIATWGSNMLTTATTWVSNTITAIGQWFSQLPSNIWNWLIQTVNSVINWGSNMLSAATTACTTVVNGIINTFKNLPSKMLEIGRNIVDGIKNGIKNAWNGMTGWLGGLCDSFIKGVKSKFDIHSPSRVMRDLIGKNIILGWMNGMQQNSSKLTGVGADISEALKESIKNDSDSYEDIGKAYIDSFKSGIEKQKESAIKSATDVINKSVDEMKAKTKDKNKISELEKNGKELINYYTKAIKEGADDATKQIDKSISKITKEAQSKYQDILKMQDNMRNKISSYGSLYDEGKGKYEAFTLHDINQDIEDLKEYSDLLNTIKSKNVGEGLMKEITNMNIDDAKEYVYTLLELDQSDLNAYVNSYEEKQKLAEQISQEFYSKQLQDLDASFTSQIGTALNDIPTQMQTVGQQAMAGFKQGLTSQMQDLMQSCKYVGNNVLNSFRDVFDIHSPSRVMRDQIGVMLAKGLDVGFTDEMPNVNADIERTLNNTVQVSKAASNTKKGMNKNDNSDSMKGVLNELKALREAFNVIINLDGEKVGELISPKVQRDLIGLVRG